MEWLFLFEPFQVFPHLTKRTLVLTPWRKPPNCLKVHLPFGEPADQKLIFGINAGDDQAFETLYHRHREWVFRMACRICGSEHLAQDVVQEVFRYFLGKFPGFELRCELRTFLYPAIRNLSLGRIVMDQTRDRILTSVAWRGRMADIWNPINTEYGSVLIDKADGRVHPVPGNPRLHTSTENLSMDLQGWPTGLVAIGDHFYYLSVSDSNKTLTREYSIFDLSPDLSVKPLTLSGRKPEKTPFDARDRTPIGIAPHNGRLMVIHPSTIAEYDPVEGDWSITAESPTRNPSSKDTHPVADAQFWECLRSIHELRVGGESTGWIALGWQHTPGVLPFASRSKGIRNISINATIPEDFLNNTFALHQVYGTSKQIRTPLKDHPRYKKPDMVVLAQTETDLILGMTTGDPFEWAYPSCNNHHLPFLWKISKEEILDQLNDD